MNDHVTDRIADLVEGRLSGEQVEAIRSHLNACEDCAADVSWVEQLRNEALENALRHLPPERIVDLSAPGPESLTAIEELHLRRCSSCSLELEWARRLPSADSIVSETTARRWIPKPTFLQRRTWAWVGASVATAAIVLLLVLQPRHETASLVQLAHFDPLPLRISRSADTTSPFEEARLLGFEAYASTDYPRAAGYLRQAAELDPSNDEVLLYWSSAEALGGNHGAASQTLERVVARAKDPAILSESLWLLANVHIALQQRAFAIESLQRLERMEAGHAVESRALLNMLNQSR